MVGVIDIGNTNIHFGLYEDEALIKKLEISVTEKSVEDRIEKIFDAKKLEGVAIASVVPHFIPRFKNYFKKKLNIIPLIVSPKVNCHLTFKYYNPETLGADRIANVVGGLARYKGNLIVIDFGTATTLDVVLKDGTYRGGMIMPGVGISLEVLSERTALLSKVQLEKPKDIIGKSTEECIQSGVFHGTIAMVNGLIRQIKKADGKNFLCISTGGWGNVMSSHIEEIKEFDPDLSLFGILKIYYYNV